MRKILIAYCVSRKCVETRKRKLAELYSVSATVAATAATGSTLYGSHDPNNASKISEAELQDANDITK